MKYVYCPELIAQEIIPEFDSNFPEVPIDRRYAPDFLQKCVAVSEETVVETGWIYDPETQTFSAPPVPEPDPVPDPEPPV